MGLQALKRGFGQEFIEFTGKKHAAEPYLCLGIPANRIIDVMARRFGPTIRSNDSAQKR